MGSERMGQADGGRPAGSGEAAAGDGLAAAAHRRPAYTCASRCSACGHCSCVIEVGSCSDLRVRFWAVLGGTDVPEGH